MTTSVDEDDQIDAFDAYFAGLGRAIRSMRIERGWSGRELARRAGISSSYVAHIEGGRKPPSSSVLFRVAEAFDVSPSDVLLRAEDEIEKDSGAETGDGHEVTRVPIQIGRLMKRMSRGDQERLLDLAKRLAK